MAGGGIYPHDAAPLCSKPVSRGVDVMSRRLASVSRRHLPRRPPRRRSAPGSRLFGLGANATVDGHVEPGYPALTLYARRRWRLCVVLAVSIGLLQTTPEILDGGESFESIALRAMLWMLETPILVIALSATADRAVARRLGTTRVVVECLLVAVASGALLALAFVLVFQGLLGVELDEKGPSPIRPSPPLARSAARSSRASGGSPSSLPT